MQADQTNSTWCPSIHFSVFHFPEPVPDKKKSLNAFPQIVHLVCKWNPQSSTSCWGFICIQLDKRCQIGLECIVVPYRRAAERDPALEVRDMSVTRSISASEGTHRQDAASAAYARTRRAKSSIPPSANVSTSGLTLQRSILTLICTKIARAMTFSFSRVTPISTGATTDQTGFTSAPSHTTASAAYKFQQK